MKVEIRHLGLALAALAVFGCSDGAPSGVTQGDGLLRLRVLLTDAPTVEFASAVVEIGAMNLLPVEGPAIELTDYAGEFDLLQLQRGVTVKLAELDVPVGCYQELRLVVQRAEVTLAGELEFVGGGQTREVKVPSGAQSGIKVKLNGDEGVCLEEPLEGEEPIDIVLDFDVYQNFRIQGNPNTPAGLKDVLFTPVLRAVVGEAATISGTVTVINGSRENLTVLATREGPSPVVATALTDADGAYSILYLAPGTYVVTVEGFDTDPASRSVVLAEGEHVTDVDFTITIPQPALSGYEVLQSNAMSYSGTGWAGWSSDNGKVVTGGGFQNPGPVWASRPFGPGGTTPFGYTYQPNEYGWIVQNGGTGGTGYVFDIYASAMGGYAIVASSAMAFGDGGYGGWSCPAGTSVLGGGFLATGPVAVSAPGTPNSVWPHYTFGNYEHGWVVRDAQDGAGNTITVFAICGYAPDGYDVVTSATLNYGDAGWGGWSCPAGKVILGGGFKADGPVAASAPGTPGSAWPHYTFGADEYGWVVQDAQDGAGSVSTLYAICANASGS